MFSCSSEIRRDVTQSHREKDGALVGVHIINDPWTGGASTFGHLLFTSVIFRLKRSKHAADPDRLLCARDKRTDILSV